MERYHATSVQSRRSRGQDASCFDLSLRRPLHYSRRQLFANATIAASRVGSYLLPEGQSPHTRRSYAGRCRPVLYRIGVFFKKLIERSRLRGS
jgi:hypothetical protein